MLNQNSTCEAVANADLHSQPQMHCGLAVTVLN